MRELSWRHHTLIQALLARGPLRKDQFHSIFTRITGKRPDNEEQLFNSYLLAINKALSFAQFELRGCRNQYDGHVYYGLVNNVSDEQSKLGTKYSVPQIAFYKAIVEAIVQDASAQGGISNIAALNLRLENQILVDSGSQSQGIPPAFKNFSISHKEKTIAELVQDQWLNSTSDGFVNLGVRSFLDLRSWFRTNDIPSCEVCNEAGVKAEMCHNEGCTVRVHQYCLEKMLSKKRSKRACPGCGTQWQGAIPTVEVSEEGDRPDITTQNPSSSHRRNKPRMNTDDEPDITSQNQSSSLKRKKPRMNTDDGPDITSQNQSSSLKRKKPRMNTDDVADITSQNQSSSLKRNKPRTNTDDGPDIPSQNQSSSLKRKKPRMNTNNDSGANGASYSQASQPPPDVKRITRSSTRQR